MVDVLKQTYNITKIPSVVIEDTVFDKLIGKDDMIKEICKNYVEKPWLCNA